MNLLHQESDHETPTTENQIGDWYRPEYFDMYRDDFRLGAVIVYDNNPTSLYLVIHINQFLFQIQNIKFHNAGADQDYHELESGYSVKGYIHGLSNERHDQSIEPYADYRKRYMDKIKEYFPEYFL